MTEATTRLRVVAPPELASGFQLGGATVHAVDTAGQAADTIDALIGEGERGVIGVYEPWLQEFDSARRDQFERSIAPVVVAVPSGLLTEAAAARRARLAGLLQRAIGYHIMFEEGG
jgi:vacuolar-type H+-ATPase subunit F/Vma7